MTVEKLRRVIFRLQAKHPTPNKYHWTELRHAIDMECGTADRTYFANKKALTRLQWIKAWSKNYFIITERGYEEC